MSGVLPKGTFVDKPEKKPRKRPERKPSTDQVRAAEQIVAGVPPAAAMAAIGMTTQPSVALKSGVMRTALRMAIEKQLRSKGLRNGIDGVAAATLVEGLDAMRPVAVGREMVSFPDYPTRGAFLDRLLKLNGDLGRRDETEEGGTWDSLVLRMRRTQPVIGE